MKKSDMMTVEASKLCCQDSRRGGSSLMLCDGHGPKLVVF